ncbi:MAG: hypothetical protein N4A71_05745 [Carboxylicivirga sp.]|jgi:hypothetical protein|nr:hypothetical protein [Carboxylicivirga sp.]
MNEIIEQLLKSNTLSTIGLVLDIIGALILVFSGLPSKYIDKRYKRAEPNLMFDNEDTRIKKKIMSNFVDNYNVKYVLWSRFGLILLIVGFSFQVVSNYITP